MNKKSYRVMRILSAAILTFFFPLAAASCFGGCDVYPGFGEIHGSSAKLSIATWNLQALFDESDDGIEYDEYRAGSGWTKEKYLARLNMISQGINAIEDGGPDILALVEVENHEIVKKLSGEYLNKNGYRYSFFTNTPGYSLGLGFLSRYPITKSYSHSSNINGEQIPRPIAEIWVEPNGQPLVIFICHWKSKLGGEDTSEIMRRNAARVILRRVQSIKAENPDIPIVVLGDLNENYDEFYRQSCEYICALLPDDPEAALLAGFKLPATDDESGIEVPDNLPVQDFLILSNEKPPVSSFFYKAEGVFYSPWGEELQNGSYYYSQNWETIDHFLLSAAFFDHKGWDYKTAMVMDVEPFINSKGEPSTYNVRTGSGLSDHLPLVLFLVNDM